MSDANSSRGRRTVRRILDSARRLFGEEGYQGASMQQVATAAGVSKGLLHYHFQSKEHLLVEAMRATFRQIFERFEERTGRGEKGMATAVVVLDALWASLRDLRAFTPFMVEVISLSRQDGPIRDDLEAFYTEVMGMLSNGIERTFEEQLEHLAVPPDRLANLVRMTTHGMVVELAMARNDEDMDRIDAVYSDMRRFFEMSVVGR